MSKQKAEAEITNIIYRDLPVLEQAIKDGDKTKALYALAEVQKHLSLAAFKVRQINGEEGD